MTISGIYTIAELAAAVQALGRLAGPETRLDIQGLPSFRGLTISFQRDSQVESSQRVRIGITSVVAFEVASSVRTAGLGLDPRVRYVVAEGEE